MSYNVVEYVVGWLFYGLQDGENGGFLSNCLPPVHQPETHIQQHTRTRQRWVKAKMQRVEFRLKHKSITKTHTTF